jgi:hypothetical protein
VGWLFLVEFQGFMKDFSTCRFPRSGRLLRKFLLPKYNQGGRKASLQTIYSKALGGLLRQECFAKAGGHFYDPAARRDFSRWLSLGVQCFCQVD